MTIETDEFGRDKNGQTFEDMINECIILGMGDELVYNLVIKGKEQGLIPQDAILCLPKNPIH